MFFFIEHHFASSVEIKVEVISTPQSLASPLPGTLYIRSGKQSSQIIETIHGSLILLGDPIFRESEQLLQSIIKNPFQIDQDVLYKEIKGHYYWFFIHQDKIITGSSFGAIYPVYYHLTESKATICSSSFFLAEQLDHLTLDSQNLLERLLFNYPFFNSTWWKEIKLLDAHHYLLIENGSTGVNNDFDLSRYFRADRSRSKSQLPHLVSVFEEEVGRFMPDEPFGISFTGGFDGRTLVPAALHSKQEFFTYSFGKPGISDMVLPAHQAQKLGIPYIPILLDEEYTEQHSLAAAWAFMEETEYNGNFGRPHYQYATRKLAEKTSYILTGNFGSELFRALHLPGVMMSRELIDIFSAKGESWKDRIKNVLLTPDRRFLSEEKESLIASIENYLEKQNGLEPNHRFYHFVFSEIARKYFGPEIIMQSNYLNNRTPFLSLRFLEELSRTGWSGIHSKLFEKNKGKRMKGQLFYATFIRQTCPPLYRLKTNKGYSPADVLESWRFPLLLAGVVKQRLLNKLDIDEHSVEAFFVKHAPNLERRIRSFSPNNPIVPQLTAYSKSEFLKGNKIEQEIKRYSIAAGWSKAGSVKSSASAVIPVLPS